MTWGIKWMIIISLRKMIELLSFAIVVTVEEEEDIDVDQVDTQDLMPMKIKWVRQFVMYRLMQEFALISMLMYSYLIHLFYTHLMIGQEYKREDEVPNEGDVIVWTPEPQSAHLSAVLLPVECPNYEVLCQSGKEFYVSQVRKHHKVLSQSGEKELQYVVHRPLGQFL